MQTANPVLKRIDKQASEPSLPGHPSLYLGITPTAPETGAPVAFPDVMVKSGILFAVCVVMAFAGWWTIEIAPGTGSLLVLVAVVASLILGISNSVMKRVSPALVILYAVASGFMLGAVSYWYNTLALKAQYQGLVLQAVLATMVTFGVMLALYGTGIVKVNGKFARVMLVAIGSYVVIGLASLVAALFGVGGGWGFYGVSGIGLLLCIFGVGLAAFSLMLDFEAIKQGIAMGLPERESWRLSFGLLVTLVWLYLEFLRLLAIVGSSR